LTPCLTYINPTKSDVKTTLHNKSFEIIYFSAHGKGGKLSPLDSHILINNVEKLYVADIVDLNYSSEVTILSACELNSTISSGIDDSSELERAFLITGSKNVISAIVPITTQSANAFFPNLINNYKSLKKKSSRPIAEAFRQACISSREAGDNIWLQVRLSGVG
jgi:CHAT domain-containing protein